MVLPAGLRSSATSAPLASRTVMRPASSGVSTSPACVAAHVGDDHVAGAGQVELVGGVLRPALRALGARQRLLRRELIRLLQRHAAVLVDVGGAAQPRHQVVGEERGRDAVRLLRAPRWRRWR